MSSIRRRMALPFVLALVALPALVPSTIAADALTLSTPYPGVEVSPGARATFSISVKTSTASRVDLSLAGVPSTWTASLHGGGLTINAVQTANGTDDVKVELDLDVPADATGTTAITLTGKGNGATVSLPLSVTVKSAASGDVKVTTDVPALKAAAGSTFTFNLNIQNDTAEDLVYTATGQGPDAGWTVDAKPSSGTQAASATVKAGSSAGLTVTVNPPDGVAANTYPITVNTTVGTKTIETDLTVEITGSYTLTLTTPNQVLSASGNAGSTTEQQFVITNTGSSPLTNVKMTATPPTNWKVDFDKPTIASIAPQGTETVTARITPTGDAIAGDYNVSVKAAGDNNASAATTIRFTVQTSIIGGIVGIGLIVLVVGGLFWVFQRYGRR